MRSKDSLCENEIEGLDDHLKVQCAVCHNYIDLDFDYGVTTDEREMGIYAYYEAEIEDNCPRCKNKYRVRMQGHVYPEGAPMSSYEPELYGVVLPKKKKLDDNQTHLNKFIK